MIGADDGSIRHLAAAVLAAAATVVMLGAGVVGAVDTVRDSGALAEKNSRLDFADREIAWGNGWMLSQNGLYAARSLIPRNADYAVMVGDASLFEDPLTYRFAESYVRYWLMPRYLHPDAAWVVCFRCDRAKVGDHVDVHWEDPEAGVSILQRRSELGP